MAKAERILACLCSLTVLAWEALALELAGRAALTSRELAAALR
jgi:hypothetical protein